MVKASCRVILKIFIQLSLNVYLTLVFHFVILRTCWINLLAANLPLVGKPCNWFVSGKYVRKHLWKSDFSKKNAIYCILTLETWFFRRCVFTQYVIVQQLLGFSKIATLAANRLRNKTEFKETLKCRLSFLSTTQESSW